MAIKPTELINRKYNENKECVGFEYGLKVEDEKGMLKIIPFYFERIAERCWEVNMISKNKNYGELRAYSTEYEIPTKNMHIETIAASGLRYIQYLMQAEVQFKSMIDFCIGDAINNM